MQLSKAILAIAITGSMLGYSTVQATEAELRATVAELASLLSDGHTIFYPRHASILRVPLSQETVVFFTIEGFGKGNGSSQYLAFFSHNEPYPGDPAKIPPYRLIAFLHVGATGWRHFDPKTAQFRNSSVKVSGLSYAPKDSSCCPTQPVSATFSVSNGRITEQSSGD